LGSLLYHDQSADMVAERGGRRVVFVTKGMSRVAVRRRHTPDQVIGIACCLALTRRPCSGMGATTAGSLPGGVQRNVGRAECIARPALEPPLLQGLDLGKAAKACADKHGRVSAASVLLVHLRALRAHGHLPRNSTSVSDTLGTHTFEVSRPEGLESVPGRSPQVRVHVYHALVHVGPTSFRLGRPRTGLCIPC